MMKTLTFSLHNYRGPYSSTKVVASIYNLGQNRVEQQTPSSQIKDEAAQKPKRAILGGREGGYILSKIVTIVDFTQKYNEIELKKAKNKKQQQQQKNTQYD